MSAKHTPGPWRWEVSAKSKTVSLCGGKPQFDLTVMDFTRWGMGGATPRFRDSKDHGLLTRCIEWARSIIGREHHSSWLQTIDHPDANLIAAAPDLLEALELALFVRGTSDDTPEVRNKMEQAIKKAKGETK